MRINRSGVVSRAVAAAGAILAALLIVASGTASAGLLIATTPNYDVKAGPLPWNVGDTVPGTLSFTNFSSTPDTATIINVDTILFTPSCAFSSGNDGVCDTVPDGTELGVFAITNVVGAALSSCAGRTFTVTVFDATTGELLFTPDAAFTLGSSDLNNGFVSCTITFDAKVLRVPTQDGSADPGKQTLGLARAQFSTAPGAQPSSNGSTQATIVGPSLVFTKTAQNPVITQGQTAQFNIVIDNTAGTGDATNVLVNDALPTALTNWVLTVVPNVPGCSITATGSPQTLTCTTLTVPAGQIVTLQLTAVTAVGAACPASMSNTAFLTGANGLPAESQSTATISCTPTSTDLSIVKSHGSTTYTPGGTINYSIVVSNAGPANSVGASVSDTVPANITGLVIGCVSTGTANCGTNASVGNNVSFTGVNINAGAGNFITIGVSGTVNPGATGVLVNTATVTPGAGQSDPTPGNNTSTDSSDPTPSTDLFIGKSDGSPTYTAGAPIVYTILVGNLGPSNATGATVTDVVPAAITGLTVNCVPTGSASCGTNGTVGNNVSFTGVNIAAGVASNFLTITVSGTVLSSATGQLINTATVAAGAGQTDPDPSNNSSTDTDDPAPNSIVTATKTNGQTTYTKGGQTVYTIVIHNNGPSDANGTVVTDNKPVQITSWAWTCVESGGASGCTPAPSNSANFTDTVNLPAGATITYTVTAQISASASGNLVNTVTGVPPAGTTGTATDIDSEPVVPVVVTAIPTLGESALIALMLMLALAGGLSARRARRT